MVLDVNLLLDDDDNPSHLCSKVRDWELLVTERLFEELYTQRQKGKAYSKDDASRNAYHALSRVGTVIPMMQFVDPVRYEVVKGLSASTAEKMPLVIPSTEPMLSDSELWIMRAQQNAMSSVLQFEHPKECEEAVRSLRSLQAKERLFPRLAELLADPKVVGAIKEHAFENGRALAALNRWTIAPTFKPARDWVTYGCEAAGMAYGMLKYARPTCDVRGNTRNARGNTPNQAYDLTYIAHMAICDGIVTNDKLVRDMAWACWPEKRQNIWTYDGKQGAIVRYAPPWGTL